MAVVYKAGSEQERLAKEQEVREKEEQKKLEEEEKVSKTEEGESEEVASEHSTEKKEKRRQPAFVIKKAEQLVRSKIPKQAPNAKKEESANLSVSRRIELDDSKKETVKKDDLPKNYYKKKKTR